MVLDAFFNPSNLKREFKMNSDFVVLIQRIISINWITHHYFNDFFLETSSV